MQIKEAQIFNFGKLQNQTWRFAPGINVIYGANESGKSTLHDFLSGMLFGIEKGRGRAAEGDTYVRYEPWHAPAYYSGALRFGIDSKEFYLERNFYVKEKRDYLRSETDGEELSVAYGDLSMLLGGMRREVFENTFDISQHGAVTGQAMAELLSEYLSDAAGGGEGNIHIVKAVSALQNRKKELNADLRNLQDARKRELERIQLETRLQEQDCEKLRNSLAGVKEHAEIKNVNAATEKRPKAMLFLPVAGILLLLLSMVCNILPLVINITGILVLIFAEILVLRKIHREKQEKQRQEEMRARDENKAIQQTEQMFAQLREHLQEKEIRLIQLEENQRQLTQPDTKIRELEEDIAAIEMAISELSRLSQEYYEDIEDELNAEISKRVSLFTAGKYDSVRLDENRKILVQADGKEVPPESLSRGTLEQIYLALRLAVGNIVAKEEEMPIFLDEAFVLYDDGRLTQTLQALAQMKRQIFIFTCQKREYTILEQLEIPYHKIELASN